MSRLSDLHASIAETEREYALVQAHMPELRERVRVLRADADTHVANVARFADRVRNESQLQRTRDVTHFLRDQG